MGFLFAFLLNIIIFHVVYILKRQFDPAPIIFYEGLKLVAICFIVGVIAIFAVRKIHGSLETLWIPAVIAALFFNYSFMITIPSLLDRSISITVIGADAKAGSSGATLEELNQDFMDVYVDGDRQVKKRLEEQMAGKHIVNENGRYVLTPKGRFVYDTNVFLAKLYNISMRYVNADKTIQTPN